MVSPAGNVVWEGHPGALTDSQIEQHLKEVQLTPIFELPKVLSKAEEALNAGKYAKGMTALAKFIAKHKSEDTTSVAAPNVQAARDALKKVKKYGLSQYKAAQRFAEDAYYAEAMRLMAELEKGFKSTKLGDKAKAKSRSWKNDKIVKAELKAGSLHERAKQLIRKKKYKQAAAFLKRLLKSSSLAKTKTRVRAEETYRRIRQYL